jgi:hypothetical protein
LPIDKAAQIISQRICSKLHHEIIVSVKKHIYTFAKVLAPTTREQLLLTF